MLNHTKKIKEIYEDIQRKLYYMIPERWEELYLYSSFIDGKNKEKQGELFFYYIPKGIFKKKPVNVYEIPAKFNLDENQYLQLVQILYLRIKELREEFKKSESGEIWTNITMIIENIKFKVEYHYEDLINNEFSSYERHIIWRYKYLNIGPEQVSKEEKEILKRYMIGAKTLDRVETYETGIYIKDIENIVDYTTEDTSQDLEYEEEQKQPKRKNQILMNNQDIENKEN